MCADCRMSAEKGAIERVFEGRDGIEYRTIGSVAPRGICGSGIIDLVSVLLKTGVINRTGRIVSDATGSVEVHDGMKKLIIAANHGTHRTPIFITESDRENVITAKAAVFAAFGNYLDIENATGTEPRPHRSSGFTRPPSTGEQNLLGWKIPAHGKAHEIRCLNWGAGSLFHESAPSCSSVPDHELPQWGYLAAAPILPTVASGMRRTPARRIDRSALV